MFLKRSYTILLVLVVQLLWLHKCALSSSRYPRRQESNIINNKRDLNATLDTHSTIGDVALTIISRESRSLK